MDSYKTSGKTGCMLCPRGCGVSRDAGVGYCGASSQVEVSHIMLHHWEEPCISGAPDDTVHGSGAVFFTHCPLGCVYCQNKKISRRKSIGETYSDERLAGAFLRLQSEGAYNINLVSPTQYTEQLISAVSIARELGLTLPIVWNTGGYELPETIRRLARTKTVDIFLTDFKYMSPQLSGELSGAPDYAEYAAQSLAEMYASAGECRIDERGIMQSGVIVRHLILPGHRADSIAVLRRIAEIVPVDKVRLSLMAQYVPDFLPEPDAAENSDRYRSLRRRITAFEYSTVLDEANRIGFDGFAQDRASAKRKYTPDF